MQPNAQYTSVYNASALRLIGSARRRVSTHCLAAAAAIVSAASVLPACSPAPNRQPSPLTAEAVALNNRAVGLMGQYEFAQARDLFARLATEHPERPELQINLAIATLHRQADGDSDTASRVLQRVIAADTTNVRAHYNLGLLLLHDGRASDALPHLSVASQHEPRDAYAQYFAAQGRFQRSDFAGALAAYERSLALNPRLRSAAYGAFQARQRLGRADAQEMLDRFKALEDNPQSEVAEFKYTRLGPLAEAATIDKPGARPASHPAGAVFDPTALHIDALPPGVSWRRLAHRTNGDALLPVSITAADIDDDGRVDLFIAGAVDDRGAVRNAVLINRGDFRFTLDLRHPLASVPDVQTALWGDVDNDGRLDVYLCRRGPNQLWRQTAPGHWERTDPRAGTTGGGGVTVDGALLDADHDGDLDILLVKADGANELLNNNGDGTFRPLAATIGLNPRRASSIGVVVADLDRDRDADIFVLRTAPPHDVHVNDRMWQYHSDPAFDAIASASIAAAVAGDLDADGNPEVYTSGPDGVRRWTRPPASSSWTSGVVPGAETLAGARQLALVDVDGDGRLDLVGTTTDGRWQAMAVPMVGSATPLYAADGEPVAGWTVAILDEHGPSIVAMPAESSRGPLIVRPGPGRFPFVTVSLSGRDARSTQIRSNASGIGTQLAARADSRWTALDTYRVQSGVGQSLQPIAIGTGGASQIDFLSMIWSDGVLQTELGLAPGAVRRIAETQRQLSSCPVLFGFDGQHFAFVTDVLGVGGIGTPSSPGVYDPPRPRENVLIPDGLLTARDRRYLLKITEPMEEVAYIDTARLVAYDVPPGWQVALDERQATAVPEATGDPFFYHNEQVPVQASSLDSGFLEDVTPAVVAADGIPVPSRHVDRRHIGRTNESVLVLRFDRPLDEFDGRPFLVADGWIEYPYAQTLFAAWQAHAGYQAPSVDARGDDGRWHTVREQFGFPAGMPRRMSVPLGTLPRGTLELRVRTTREIYWDRLAVAYSEECRRVSKQVLPLSSARVVRSGFPRRETAPNRRPSYDYARRAPLWDVRYPRGFYTAEGTATELLADEDGAVAIIGPGEELHLEFDSALHPLRPGWTRRFVLEARGWCKDMDLYTKDGETVEPIPGNRGVDAERLQRRYTTRYQSGR